MKYYVLVWKSSRNNKPFICGHMGLILSTDNEDIEGFNPDKDFFLTAEEAMDVVDGDENWEVLEIAV